MGLEIDDLGGDIACQINQRSYVVTSARSWRTLRDAGVENDPVWVITVVQFRGPRVFPGWPRELSVRKMGGEEGSEMRGDAAVRRRMCSRWMLWDGW